MHFCFWGGSSANTEVSNDKRFSGRFVGFGAGSFGEAQKMIGEDLLAPCWPLYFMVGICELDLGNLPLGCTMHGLLQAWTGPALLVSKEDKGEPLFARKSPKNTASKNNTPKNASSCFGPGHPFCSVNLNNISSA